MKNRKTIRLKDYDYSQNGAYFITICTDKRKYRLCKLRRDAPCGCPITTYSNLGKIILEEILTISEKYHVIISKYVIMPNHVHMIIIIENSEKGHPQGASLRVTIPQIIGAFKSTVSFKYFNFCKEKNIFTDKIWQRSYYEHIIRNQKDYDEKWKYIDENPFKWELDDYYIKEEKCLTK